ncbi:hypothetical protein Stsp01_01210 [Streptomyces sp. NBRC 13847]|nr:hypothetical protein Stsp01_01210 [Streptomyces sp. NBRC 13847]
MEIRPSALLAVSPPGGTSGAPGGPNGRRGGEVAGSASGVRSGARRPGPGRQALAGPPTWMPAIRDHS